MADIYIYRGEDVQVDVQLNSTDGQVYDLTGATVTADIKSSQGQKLASWTITVVNAQQGQIRLQLSAQETAALPAGTALTDIKIQDSGGRTFYVPHPPDAPWQVEILDPVTE